MTQVQFTLSQEDIQELINTSVEDSLSKQILQTIFQQLMEEQRNEYINAENYERGENRVSQRNGYYDREYTTRVGTLQLRVPRTRDGNFSVDLFERYQRHEKALLTTMLEMYISGVSTRKVGKVVEKLCGKSFSKSFVSSLTKDLDEQITAWQYSSLEGTNYPYIIVDVIYIKVREENRVVSRSFHIALGINEEGYREVIGFLLQEKESEDTWTNFFDYLKSRGLTGVEMVISDAHQGLVNAITKCFTGASWQRCQVHLLRNIMDAAPKKDRESKNFKEKVKAIFRFTSIDIAREAKDKLIEEYGDNSRYEKACNILDDGFEDAFQYTYQRVVHIRLNSTNMLERLNGEIRRREKVIRIFPNRESATRLIGSILMDINEDWIGSSRKYINFES